MRAAALSLVVVAATLAGCATTSSFSPPPSTGDVCIDNGCAAEEHPELVERCIEAQCGPHGAHIVAPDQTQKHDVADATPLAPSSFEIHGAPDMPAGTLGRIAALRRSGMSQRAARDLVVRQEMREQPDVVAFQGPLELVHHVPALAGSLQSAPAFPFTCTSTPQRITPPSGNADYLAIWVWAGTNAGGASATPIFIGDAGVTTTNGMPLCSGNCPAVDKSYEVRGLWCVVTSTSVSITAQVARP